MNFNNKIVTDGLVLCLDAADKKSYSGSGASWPAKVGGTANLDNAPTYTSANPTYFNFDGVNQYGPGAQYAFVETDATTVTFVSGLTKVSNNSGLSGIPSLFASGNVTKILF